MSSSRPAASESPAATSLQDHVVRQTFPAAHPWLAVLILVAAVVLAYRGVWHLGFIWDDDIYLTRNRCIVGPLHFTDIWTSMHARICPLVISCFWLQFQFWGLNALPYHLVNVGIHAASAVVLWRTLQVLGVRGAWLGAALWAIHPVQVESVAWISELKNTQSGLFFVLCVYVYAQWEKAGGVSRRQYMLAVLFAALAMASKSSTVVLPPVLLLCSWWLTGTVPFKRWLAIIPFGLLALATVALSVWSQNLEGANDAEWARSGPERLITAGRVMWFYLGKLAWPQPLMFIYPRWNVNPASALEWLPVVACVVVALGLLLLVRRVWARAAVFAGGVFVIALLPVAGLVDHYFLRYSFVGDHFVYLASMGPLALVAAGITTLANRLGSKSWDAISLVCGAVVVLLGFVSAAHVPIFKDDITLWSDSLERNPGAWIAANNLGTAYLSIGRPDLARQHYEQVLRKDGKNALAAGNMGVAIMNSSSAKDAESFYQNAIKTFPQEGSIFNNLGLAQASQGRYKDAIVSYRQAIAVSPKNGEAHLNLANALLSTGQFAEAVQHYRESIKFLSPTSATYHSLATALLSAGDADAALEYYQKVLALEPNSVVLHYNLGNALAQAGRTKEAVEAYERVLRLQGPGFAMVEAVHNLAWVLATTTDDAVRNGKRAVEVLQFIKDRSVAQEPMMLRVQAAAEFETGEKDKAMATARNALLLATVSHNMVLEHDLKADLEGYQQGRPVRNAPVKRAE